MHHPRLLCAATPRAVLGFVLAALVLASPDIAMAQASPFLTGASALQTKGRTFLAAAARVREALPGTQVRAFALLRTLGLARQVDRLLSPCQGEIRWARGDARREP